MAIRPVAVERQFSYFSDERRDQYVVKAQSAFLWPWMDPYQASPQLISVSFNGVRNGRPVALQWTFDSTAPPTSNSIIDRMNESGVDTSNAQLRRETEFISKLLCNAWSCVITVADPTPTPFNSTSPLLIYRFIVTGRFKTGHLWALQNRPPVGASKPASVVGLRIPHSLLVSNNYWTHHQSFFMSRRKRALCPWMPAANTIVTVNRQRFPDRR